MMLPEIPELPDDYDPDQRLPCIGGPRDGEMLSGRQLPGAKVEVDTTSAFRAQSYKLGRRDGRLVWRWQDENEPLASRPSWLSRIWSRIRSFLTRRQRG